MLGVGIFALNNIGKHVKSQSCVKYNLKQPEISALPLNTF